MHRASGVRSFYLPLLFVIGAVIVSLGPGCGRTSLEPESLDSGAVTVEGGSSGSSGTSDSGPSCGPATCPSGCCDATGGCRVGSDVRACGGGGSRCADCVADGFTLCNGAHVCGRDDPACSATSCAIGCCANDEGKLRCLSGSEPAACGRGGGACVNCGTAGAACDVSTRACGTTTCTAANCTGCCVGDKCLPGDTAAACGTRGASCNTCGIGQSCGPATGGGGTCSGVSVCGPANCGGCCDPAGRCLVGTDKTACGKQGESCKGCSGDLVCIGDALPNERTCQPLSGCNAATCKGCCAGNQCITATTSQACGTAGKACAACGAGQICEGGACVSGTDCNSPVPCRGCCLGDICALGNQDNACGAAGAECQNCANTANQVCTAGSCRPATCNAANCRNGCCYNGDTCVTGNQDNACGPRGGGRCEDCTRTDRVCTARTCTP